MLVSPLSGRHSLRDLVDTFNRKQSRHYHLGTREISRSSLADANGKRPKMIYNAVIIQALIAMIAYLLLRLTQLAGYSALSLPKIARLVSVKLTRRRAILALLNPSSTKPPTRCEREKQMSFDFSFA